MPQSNADDLLAYFTDVEDLRDLLRVYLATPELPKRLLVIHGVGGIGKSSLLRMFRLHCKSVKTPVALASGDEAKSVVAILGDWADDLKADDVTLAAFTKTRQHYRALQAKAEDKAQESRKKMGDLAGKTAGKVAETAAGMAVGAAIGSVIPGLGTIAGALGGMGAEALVDWLRGQGFTRLDVDFLLDPTKKLTDDFLADIERVAPKRRLVLMLDTFEQLSVLEDWARDLAQRLHPNVLLVLAGRAMPNWSRAWSGWLAKAHVEELKPMTDDVMRELVRRYYTTIRGGEPDPKQVEAIIAFARGLPMVVTSAVQLWVEYSVEDFEAVKAEVVADLVDRLKEGVSKEITPVLEAAATVRWFNKDILRAVTGLADVNQAYDEFRRFPFVRSRVEGLALHDAVREIMDEYLRMHDPERHRDLHERAAGYFEAQMAERTGEEAERLGLERLFHRICVDEEAGTELFQEMAEELTRYRLVNRLRALLNDARTYSLERENSRLWREYYNARLAHLEVQLTRAEQEYRSIGSNEKAAPKLRAYALCSLGHIISRWRRLGKSGQIAEVLEILERSLKLVIPDAYLMTSTTNLAHVYEYMGDWDKAVACYAKSIQFHQEEDNVYQLIDVYSKKRAFHAQRGEWREMFTVDNLGQQVLPKLVLPSHIKAVFLGWTNWGWAFAGRYAEGERRIKEELSLLKDLDDKASLADFYRDLTLLIGVQDRYNEALSYSDKSELIVKSLGEDYRAKIAFVLSHKGLVLVRKGEWSDARALFAESLQVLDSFNMTQDASEVLVFLGMLCESRKDWQQAIEWYRKCLEMRRITKRLHFECAALTALVRIKHAQGEYLVIPPLLAEAEQLAQQYEYNDHLASLRLTQGHVAWDGSLPEWGRGFDAALRYYQHALIYALRYNRFLLDEAVSGRPQGTPLRPIIPHCLERREEGRQMLIALRDWWQTGVNDVDAPRPDTISPIPEGIPLLEAERIAREREPGDGSPQRTVLEQIDAALSEPNSVQLTTEDQQ